MVLIPDTAEKACPKLFSCHWLEVCKQCCSPEGAISFWNFSMLDCGNSSLTKLLYPVAFQKKLSLLRCMFCKVTTSISTFCCRVQLMLILSEMYNSTRKFSLFQRKVSFWDEVSVSCSGYPHISAELRTISSLPSLASWVADIIVYTAMPKYPFKHLYCVLISNVQ